MPIYMQYDKGNIKGDVTADGHADWIELNSLQFGVGRGISSPIGGSQDRESSAPSVSEITVSKLQDKASGDLLTAAYQGEGVNVNIDLCKTDKGKLETFLTIELTDVMISGYSMTSNGERPAESLSLNFVTINFVPKVMNKDGTMSDASKVKYDIGQAKVV